jgi:hypothetical protein
MSREKLLSTIGQLHKGIEACIENKLTRPALILIYSAIDTVSWLDSKDEYANRTSFMAWVDSYLIKARPIRCSSKDLYGARCGILHTCSADSRLSKVGEARLFCYAWGSAGVDIMQETIDLARLDGEFVTIHVTELFDAWDLGVKQFLKDIEKNAAREARVLAKARRFFDEYKPDNVQRFRDILKKNKPPQSGPR